MGGVLNEWLYGANISGSFYLFHDLYHYLACISSAIFATGTAGHSKCWSNSALDRSKAPSTWRALSAEGAFSKR